MPSVLSAGPSFAMGDFSGSVRAEPWVEQYRLPDTTLPQHYDLYIFPNLDTKLFSGHQAAGIVTIIFIIIIPNIIPE